MNTKSYYLNKSNGIMEGPYLIEDLKSFIKADEISISKENIVINSTTGEKCTIEEAISSFRIEKNTTDFPLAFEEFRNQQEIQKKPIDLDNPVFPFQKYQVPGNLMQSSRHTVVHTNKMSVMGNVTPVTIENRNHLVAGIFALLLGSFGAHKFYNGSWGWGIIYILLCWTYIPLVFAIIEGIFYLLNRSSYDRKYNMVGSHPMKW